MNRLRVTAFAAIALAAPLGCAGAGTSAPQRAAVPDPIAVSPSPAVPSPSPAPTASLAPTPLATLAPTPLPTLVPAASTVFTMTNARSGNAIVRFVRNGDGSLTPGGNFATGGLGSGDALGESQGSIALSADGRFLFVVNAGSDDVSSFAVAPTGLTLVDRQSAGGVHPIGLAVASNLMYTLDAGSSTVAGLRIASDGRLTPIAGSSRPLSAQNVSPQEIAFSPTAPVLVATERGTDRIDVFSLDATGTIVSTTSQRSVGAGPFGFAFTPRGTLVVSEQFGDRSRPGGGASAYTLDPSGMLRVLSASVENGQLSPCWVALDPTGRYAYVTNTSGATLSVYAVGADGALALVTAAVPTAGFAFDDAVTRDGRFLYVVDSLAGTLVGFAIGTNGAVAPISSTPIPLGALGLASL